MACTLLVYVLWWHSALYSFSLHKINTTWSRREYLCPCKRTGLCLVYCRDVVREQTRRKRILSSDWNSIDGDMEKRPNVILFVMPLLNAFLLVQIVDHSEFCGKILNMKNSFYKIGFKTYKQGLKSSHACCNSPMISILQRAVVVVYELLYFTIFKYCCISVNVCCCRWFVPTIPV